MATSTQSMGVPLSRVRYNEQGRRMGRRALHRGGAWVSRRRGVPSSRAGGDFTPPPVITAEDVLGRGRGASSSVSRRALKGEPRSDETAVFFLLGMNLVGYLLDHVLHLPVMKAFYLHHMAPQWWQFLTSLFCHGSWAHLSSNIFFLYIFGKLVEEEEGWGGLIASYLICGAGASVASYLLLSKQSVSLGASGAVFGLFVVSVLCKLQAFNWRRAIEVLILGQFVVEKVASELSVSVAGGKIAQGMVVNHVAHLAGAAIGALLIYLVALIPEKDSGPEY